MSRVPAQEEIEVQGHRRESVEAKTLGMRTGGREVGRKTNSRKVKIECALRVI
jgi:hypothetical protein